MGIRATVNKLLGGASAERARPAKYVLGEHHAIDMRPGTARDHMRHYPPRYVVAGWQPAGSLSRWSGWTRASQAPTAARVMDRRPRVRQPGSSSRRQEA